MSTIESIRRSVWKAMRRGLLAALLIPLSQAGAEPLYVDVNAPVFCACLYPIQNNDPACGQPEKPFSCIRDAVNTALAFNTVIVRDGIYNECVGISKSGTEQSQLTVESESKHGAHIACPAEAQLPMVIMLTANYVTVKGFRVSGASVGVYVYGAPVGESGTGVSNVLEDLEIFGNQSGVLIQRNCTSTRLTRLDIHDNDPHDGIKLDTIRTCSQTVTTYCKVNSDCPLLETCEGMFIRDTVIEDSQIHHNYSNGIHEGNAERTVVRGCEIDNNGHEGIAHGLYMKGFEGLIENNKIHHNAGYGIHFWAAPRGSAARHYIAERNDVFGNGSGVVVGGAPEEASPHDPLPQGDGLPHFVEVRYNSIHHNIGFGFNYLGYACHPASNDNSFHHNTVYRNGGSQLQIVGAAGTKLLVKNNIIVGRTYPADDNLISFFNTNFEPNALDGNIYSIEGAESGTTPGVFLWTCPGAPTTRYTFDQIRNPGLDQDNSCFVSDCGSSNPVPIDVRSRWTNLLVAPPLVVDPSTSAWSNSVGMTRGDFHLLRGSPAASGGVCCDVSNAGTDIDDETVPVCSPTSDCLLTTSAQVAVGADYPLDDNADGVANRYECESPNGSLCDGDMTAESSEIQFCPASLPGAPYDPAVFPSNPEVCDGKDNDCNTGTTAGGGENDLDQDGYYAPCGLDCNEASPTIYPGAREICDGIDNNCAGGIDEGHPNTDGDSLADCVDPGFDISIQVTPTGACPSGTEGCISSGTYTNLNASSLNNTREVLSEHTMGSQRKLTKIWTLNIVPGTYDLRVEGHRTAGGNKASDNFNFSYVTKASGACSTGDAFGSTILTVTKPADDDQLQVATLGVLNNPVVCLRVRDSNLGTDSQSDLLHLDRVFLYRYPPCVDGDGDGYTASCSACINSFCPTVDCDDGDSQESPGLTEGPYGNPTCSDTKDNNCNGLIDAADTAVCSPTQYVLVELPNADAGPNQGTPSSPSSLHYLKVDDDPHDGDTTTLSFSSGGQKEVYTTADQLLSNDTVTSVKVRWVAKKGSGSGWKGEAGLVIGTTEYYGPTRTLTTNYFLYEENFPNNPATSQAWTVTDVRNAKLIYQQVQTNTQLPRASLTELVLVVTVLR